MSHAWQDPVASGVTGKRDSTARNPRPGPGTGPTERIHRDSHGGVARVGYRGNDVSRHLHRNEAHRCHEGVVAFYGKQGFVVATWFQCDCC